MPTKSKFSKPNQFTKCRIFEGDQCIVINGICVFKAWRLSPRLRGYSTAFKNSKAFKPTFLSLLDLLQVRYSQQARPKSGSRLTPTSEAVQPASQRPTANPTNFAFPDQMCVADSPPSLCPRTQPRPLGRSGPPPPTGSVAFPGIDNLFPASDNPHPAMGNSRLAKPSSGSTSRQACPRKAQLHPASRQSNPA